MFSAFCHDIDHRGVNNAFLVKYNEPLATLYETSTMENHHWSLTYKLLEVRDCDAVLMA